MATFGFLATASRQTWAFARDRGLPFSNFFAKVNKRLALPLRAIVLCSIIPCLIGLINIGSTVAFNAIVSLTEAGLFISYLIPIILIMIKKIKGEHIKFGKILSKHKRKHSTTSSNCTPLYGRVARSEHCCIVDRLSESQDFMKEESLMDGNTY